MKNYRIIIYIVVAIAFLIPTTGFASGSTASVVMNSAASKINAAKGISCSFTLTSDSRNIQGTLKQSLNKFAVSTPASSSWYNGKQMWSYNPQSKETSLFIPTASEIREVNPFEYVKSWSAMFTPSFSNRKESGKYVILLSPKKRNSEIKSAEIVIDVKTLKPSSIKLNLKSGATSVVKIKTLDYNARFIGSDFEYPRSKYPKVKVIDLR